VLASSNLQLLVGFCHLLVGLEACAVPANLVGYSLGTGF